MKLWENRSGGGSESDKVVFYTSLYRTYERMINISEDGKYYSAFDGQVHDDNGIPFIPMIGFGIPIGRPIPCVS